MKTYFTLIFASLFSLGLIAQSHTEAKALLEEVKVKTAEFKNQKIEFSNTMDSPTGNEAKPRSKRSMNGTMRGR